MASLNGPIYLAPVGSTGNGNFTASGVNVGTEADSVAIQVVVEAVGGTPTATFSPQGSIDGTNWFTIPFLTPTAGAESSTPVALTAVGAALFFVSLPVQRIWPKIRIVVTANTNVTFRAELYSLNGLN